MHAVCTCSYCLWPSRSLGDLYNARTYMPDHMAELSSGLFLLNGASLETMEHVSRFSLRFARHGLQDYRLGGSTVHRIDPTSCLVINEGQSYATRFVSDNVSMYGIAFRPSLARDIVGVSRSTDEALLDRPLVDVREATVPWGDSVQMMDSTMAAIASTAWDLLHMPAPDASTVEHLFVQAAEHAAIASHERQRRSDAIKARRAPTRDELLRRVTIGRDYLAANAHRHVTMAEAGRECAMSEYHFIRTFSEAFGESPFVWLTRCRITQAKALLEAGDLTVSEVAYRCGFDSVSSFVRRFRLATGATPGTVRSVA
ncbi:MAG: AraC family transcriptional regulator [Candidatus Kapabacteria bacterium]|nr:AraC family transcriptional regulator [Candidatus Kapabacteria bacterium]